MSHLSYSVTSPSGSRILFLLQILNEIFIYVFALGSNGLNRGLRAWEQLRALFHRKMIRLAARIRSYEGILSETRRRRTWKYIGCTPAHMSTLRNLSVGKPYRSHKISIMLFFTERYNLGVYL